MIPFLFRVAGAFVAGLRGAPPAPYEPGDELPVRIERPVAGLRDDQVDELERELEGARRGHTLGDRRPVSGLHFVGWPDDQ